MLCDGVLCGCEPIVTVRVQSFIVTALWAIQQMTKTFSYKPEKVWKWVSQDGGAFTKINRPIAGATHDKDLPKGKHPLQLYSLGTPNGIKVTILLEESPYQY